jgi:hypothetical protein
MVGYFGTQEIFIQEKDWMRNRRNDEKQRKNVNFKRQN